MSEWFENIIWFVVIRLFKEPETIDLTEPEVRWEVLRQHLEIIQQLPTAKEPGAFAAYEFPEESFNEFIDKIIELEEHIRNKTLKRHPKVPDLSMGFVYYNEYFSNVKKRHSPERIRHILISRVLSIIMLFEKFSEQCSDEYTLSFYQRRVETGIEACLIILETFYHG